MWKTLLGGVGGGILGIAVGGALLAGFQERGSPNTTREAWFFMALFSGGPCAIVGALVGATSAIVKAIRENGPSHNVTR